MKDKNKEDQPVEETAPAVDRKPQRAYKPGAKKTIQFRKGRRVKGGETGETSFSFSAEPGEVVTLPAQEADHYIDTGYAFEVAPTKNKEV